MQKDDGEAFLDTLAKLELQSHQRAKAYIDDLFQRGCQCRMGRYRYLLILIAVLQTLAIFISIMKG